MPDPLFDPLRKKLDRELRKYLIGRTLGQCPRTGKSMDVRTAVFVLDRDGDPYMALHQDGWAEVVAQNGGQDVRELAAAGFSVDLSTIRSGELAQTTGVLLGLETPAGETPDPNQPALF